MTGDPTRTLYSANEIVPKSDPRIARRGALDSLYAEAWLLYKEAVAEDARNYSRTNILLEIAYTLGECIRSEAVLADPDWRSPVFIHATAWFDDMRKQCAELAQERFGDVPKSVIGAKINVLRAHIREVELMFCHTGAEIPFCYKGALEIYREIQWRLNELSGAAYVAMWAGEDE